MALRMRQSLAALEEQFRQDMEYDQVESEQRRHRAVKRTRTRRRARGKEAQLDAVLAARGCR